MSASPGQSRRACRTMRVVRVVVDSRDACVCPLSRVENVPLPADRACRVSWRRARDSNPQGACAPADFKTRCHRLLTHLRLTTATSQTASTALAQVGPNETAFADGGHSDGHTEPIPLVGTSANRAQAAHARHACRVADGTRSRAPSERFSESTVRASTVTRRGRPPTPPRDRRAPAEMAGW
jgi:hypothetical protein